MAPLRAQSLDAAAEHRVHRLHEVEHAPVPRRSVVRGGGVDRGVGRVGVQLRELQRDHGVEDEVARAERVQLAQRVQLAVRDVCEGHVRTLGVRDEGLTADVVGPDVDNDDELVGVYAEPLLLRAGDDMILDKPVGLAAEDVGHVLRLWGSADGARGSVVPDRVVAVQAEIPGGITRYCCEPSSVEAGTMAIALHRLLRCPPDNEFSAHPRLRLARTGGKISL